MLTCDIHFLSNTQGWYTIFTHTVADSIRFYQFEFCTTLSVTFTLG